MFPLQRVSCCFPRDTKALVGDRIDCPSFSIEETNDVMRIPPEFTRRAEVYAPRILQKVRPMAVSLNAAIIRERVGEIAPARK